MANPEAKILSETWIDKMQWFFGICANSQDPAYMFKEQDFTSYVEPRAFAAMMKRASESTQARGILVRNLRTTPVTTPNPCFSGKCLFRWRDNPVSPTVKATTNHQHSPPKHPTRTPVFLRSPNTLATLRIFVRRLQALFEPSMAVALGRHFWLRCSESCGHFIARAQGRTWRGRGCPFML